MSLKRALALAFVLSLVPIVPAAATTLLAPAPRFLATGSGTVSVDGIAVPGRFSADFEVVGAGITIRRLVVEIPDFVLVTTAFFGLVENRTPFLCTVAANDRPVAGTVGAGGALTFAAGAARLLGVSYGQRLSGGTCGGDTSLFDATNNAGFTGTHNPAGNFFRLQGSFSAVIDGRSVPVVFSLTGSYRNRPPLARIGVVGLGIDLSQGGCPPLTGANPPLTEANDPAGLKVELRSVSTDPESTATVSDVAVATWEGWSGTAPESPGSTHRFFGRGQRVGPVTFGFGTAHVLALKTFDHTGAASAAQCGFTVADRTPPLVTAPAALTTVCTSSSGATRVSSPAIATFLTGATATDRVDPAPVFLAPQVLGADVTDTTLFPTGTTRTVTFRARDRFNNVGSATRNLTVTSDPRVKVTLPVTSLAPTGLFVTIKPTVSAVGCGHSRLELVRITHNGTEAISTLVTGASYGTLDTQFDVKAVPITTSTGGRAPRIYTIVYRGVGTDGRSLETSVTLTVRVF